MEHMTGRHVTLPVQYSRKLHTWQCNIRCIALAVPLKVRLPMVQVFVCMYMLTNKFNYVKTEFPYCIFLCALQNQVIRT